MIYKNACEENQHEQHASKTKLKKSELLTMYYLKIILKTTIITNLSFDIF